MGSQVPAHRSHAQAARNDDVPSVGGPIGDITIQLLSGVGIRVPPRTRLPREVTGTIGQPSDHERSKVNGRCYCPMVICIVQRLAAPYVSQQGSHAIGRARFVKHVPRDERLIVTARHRRTSCSAVPRVAWLAVILIPLELSRGLGSSKRGPTTLAFHRAIRTAERSQ